MVEIEKIMPEVMLEIEKHKRKTTPEGQRPTKEKRTMAYIRLMGSAHLTANNNIVLSLSCLIPDRKGIKNRKVLVFKPDTREYEQLLKVLQFQRNTSFESFCIEHNKSLILAICYGKKQNKQLVTLTTEPTQPFFAALKYLMDGSTVLVQCFPRPYPLAAANIPAREPFIYGGPTFQGGLPDSNRRRH